MSMSGLCCAGCVSAKPLERTCTWDDKPTAGNGGMLDQIMALIAEETFAASQREAFEMDYRNKCQSIRDEFAHVRSALDIAERAALVALGNNMQAVSKMFEAHQDGLEVRRHQLAATMLAGDSSCEPPTMIPRLCVPSVDCCIIGGAKVLESVILGCWALLDESDIDSQCTAVGRVEDSYSAATVQVRQKYIKQHAARAYAIMQRREQQTFQGWSIFSTVLDMGQKFEVPSLRVVASPDCSLLAVCGVPNCIVLVSLVTADVKEIVPYPARLTPDRFSLSTSIAFSENSRTLLMSRLTDALTPGEILEVTFSGDIVRTIVSGCTDLGGFFGLDCKHGVMVALKAPPKRPLVCIFNYSTGELMKTIGSIGSRGYHSAKLSQDGKMVGLCDGYRIRFYSLAGEFLASFELPLPLWGSINVLNLGEIVAASEDCKFDISVVSLNQDSSVSRKYSFQADCQRGQETSRFVHTVAGNAVILAKAVVDTQHLCINVVV